MPRRKVRYYSPKRRAIYAAGEQFTHLEIFERDGWVCGICEGTIDKLLRYPNPLCATIDHIVEISKCLADGWPIETIHTRENAQAAHLKCNLEKSQCLGPENTA